MATYFMKELFKEKKYNEVIENMYYLYEGLYIKMIKLMEKKLGQKINVNDSDFFSLHFTVKKYYPKFEYNLTKINNSFASVDETNIQVIHTLVNEFMYIEDNYLNEVNNYTENNENLDEDEFYLDYEEDFDKSDEEFT